MRSLTEKEMRTTSGGISILRIKGLNDGVKKNTEVFLLGIRIYHGKNA